MANSYELHVVLGASGGTGSAVVRELVRRGHRVRAVNRGGDADVPDGSAVERAKGDVADPEGARRACAGRAPAPRSSTTAPSPSTRSGGRSFR